MTFVTLGRSHIRGPKVQERFWWNPLRWTHAYT